MGSPEFANAANALRRLADAMDRGRPPLLMTAETDAALVALQQVRTSTFGEALAAAAHKQIAALVRMPIHATAAEVRLWASEWNRLARAEVRS